MKSSIDLKRCRQLFTAEGIAVDSVTDETEEAFREATSLYSSADVRDLRLFSYLAVTIKTMAEIERLCEVLGNSKAGKKLSAVVRRLGKNDRDRLNKKGVDARDFSRGYLLLLHSVPEEEVEHLIDVMLAYGRAVGAAILRELSDELRGSSEGESIRHALELTQEPLRKSASRARVSAAAISKSATRIRQKLCWKG